MYFQPFLSHYCVFNKFRNTEFLPQLTLDDAEAVGVVGAEGAEGREAPLWEAEEEERVGEALREPGLERRPRERNVVRPWGPPSGRMNFSLSSRLVRPRAETDEKKSS